MDTYGSKPIAILGDGPCLSDITDEDALCENRFVVAVQGASLKKKCHVAFMGDPYAIKYAMQFPDTQVIWATTTFASFNPGFTDRKNVHVVPSHHHIHGDPLYVQTAEYSKPFSRQNVGTGILACRHAFFHSNADSVELYGFDLCSDDPCCSKVHEEMIRYHMMESFGVEYEPAKQYVGQREAMTELRDAMPGFFVNCSPSSRCDLFPREERPWTSQLPSLETAPV